MPGPGYREKGSSCLGGGVEGSGNEHGVGLMDMLGEPSKLEDDELAQLSVGEESKRAMMEQGGRGWGVLT